MAAGTVTSTATRVIAFTTSGGWAGQSKALQIEQLGRVDGMYLGMYSLYSINSAPAILMPVPLAKLQIKCASLSFRARPSREKRASRGGPYPDLAALINETPMDKQVNTSAQGQACFDSSSSVGLFRWTSTRGGSLNYQEQAILLLPHSFAPSPPRSAIQPVSFCDGACPREPQHEDGRKRVIEEWIRYKNVTGNGFPGAWASRWRYHHGPFNPTDPANGLQQLGTIHVRP